MANTYVDYTGDGSQDTFSITFPYLSNTHVTVLVGGVTKTEASHYNIATGSIVFTAGNIPADTVAVRVKRVTERDSALVDFKDGSTLLEADLDTANLQSFYIAQETDESAFQADSSGNYDASDNKLVNVGTPTADTDGVTKAYVDTQILTKDNLDEIAEGTTNVHFTASDNTKLDGIETAATADQTGAEIKTLYEGEANAYTDTKDTKLSGIATGAEVNVQSDWDASSGDAQVLNKPSIPVNLTDLTNVSATGGTAPSDGQVLKWDNASSIWKPQNDESSSGGSGASEFVELNDTPSDLSGQGGKTVKVNSAGNALEFETVVTGGTVTGVTGTSPIVSDGDATTPAISITDSSTSAKGAASFSSDNFDVTAGAVTIKTGGVDLTDEVTGSLPDGNIASAATWSGKQDALTFNAPSSNNSNPSTSAEILTALNGKAGVGTNADIDKLTGLEITAPLVFEGTADDHETTVTVTDPTADRTITIPDRDVDLGATGTFAESGHDHSGVYEATDTTIVRTGTVDQKFTKGIRGDMQTVTVDTGADTATCDLNDSNNFAITLQASDSTAISFSNLDADSVGQSGIIVLTHAGGATSFGGGVWKWEAGTAPTVNTSGVDVIAYYVESATRVSTVFLGNMS